MPNYKLALEYNGSDFHGSQAQPNKRTVQGELETCLNSLYGPEGSIVQNPELIFTTFSSRTDTGVHALEQIINFKLEPSINLRNDFKVLAAINNNLPEDIVAVKIKEVADSFHARHDATAREYLYKIFIRRHRPVLRLDSLMWQKEPLDFERMAKHATTLVGEQDFSRFAKLEAEDSGLCEVLKSELIQESKLCFKYKIKANRFLRHMVRRIVGELIQVGQGQEASAETCNLSVPASGLCLIDVEYPNCHPEEPKATSGSLSVPL
ncbi:MAG: tRNA pseudouridine(38-40) synthase TruA [Candidatus Melainabacteria bacterium]|nr:tRNA pseudouridine(38-40) synthase TruA [Candidatus Melainabacteria bacterium]